MLATRIAETDNQLHLVKGRHLSLQERLEKFQTGKQRATAAELLYRKVTQFLEKCSELTKQDIKEKLETLVTWAIRSILQTDEFKFKVEFVSRRNQVECDFYVEDKEGNKLDLIQSCGGGLVDIVSMALRIVLTELAKVEGPLILDEPYRMVSTHYIDNASEFLRQVSKKLDRQLIIVTHNQALAKCADKLFEVSIEGGISQVKAVWEIHGASLW